MKFFVLIFLLLLALVPHAAQAQQFNEQWMLCRQQSDCVLVPGICNEDMVINRNYIGAFMIYKKAALDAGLSCDPNVPRFPNLIPRCIEGECAYDMPFDVQ